MKTTGVIFSIIWDFKFGEIQSHARVPGYGIEFHIDGLDVIRMLQLKPKTIPYVNVVVPKPNLPKPFMFGESKGRSQFSKPAKKYKGGKLRRC